MKKFLLSILCLFCTVCLWGAVTDLSFTATRTIAAGGEIWWTTSANVAAANTAGWCSTNTNASNNKKGNITPNLKGDIAGASASYSMDGVLVKATYTPADLTTSKKALVFKVTNTTGLTVYGGTTGSSQAVSVWLSVYKADGTEVDIDNVGVGAGPNMTCTTTVTGLDDKETYIVNIIGGLKATADEKPATTAGGQDMVVYAIKFSAPASGKTESSFTLTSASELILAPNATSQITTTGNAGTISYTSGANSIATVSNTGLITAVSGGITTITVSDQGSDAVDGKDLSVSVKALYEEDKVSTTFKFDNAGYFLAYDGKWYFKNGWSITTTQNFQYAALNCNDKSNNGFKVSAGKTYTINVPDGVNIRSARVIMRSNYGSDKAAANWGTIFGQDLSSETLPFSSEEAAVKEFEINNATPMTFTPGGNQCQMYFELSTEAFLQNSNLALSSTTANVNLNRSVSLTYTSSSTGAVTVSSDNPATATARVEGNTIIINGIAAGTATITVSQAADGSYKAGEATIDVTVNDPSAPTAIFSAEATTPYSVPANTSDGSLDGYATVTGGSMTVYNGQTSSKDLIKTQAGVTAFSATNGNTYFKATLSKALQAGDIVSIKILGGNKNGENAGIAVKTTYEAQNPDVVLTSDGQGSWKSYNYTIKSDDDIEGATSVVFCRTAGTTTYFTDIVINRPARAEITISSAGYATYVAPFNLDFSESAVTAYAVQPNIAENKVSLIPQTKVPAGKAIVVKATPGDYTIPFATEAVDFYTELEVSAEATVYDDEYTYYYLGQENGQVGFRPLAEGGRIAAGKCFFKVAKTPGSPGSPFLRIDIEDMEDGNQTAISEINTDANNNVMYDLQGRRTANGKGLLIQNGKVILVK